MRALLTGEDVTKIKEQVEALKTSAMEIGRSIYKGSGSTGSGDAGAGAGPNPGANPGADSGSQEKK